MAGSGRPNENRTTPAPNRGNEKWKIIAAEGLGETNQKNGAEQNRWLGVSDSTVSKNREGGGNEMTWDLKALLSFWQFRAGWRKLPGRVVSSSKFGTVKTTNNVPSGPWTSPARESSVGAHTRPISNAEAEWRLVRMGVREGGT